MTFLNPLGLLGLLSLPLIVGLHLHLERNRRVVVSSMFLWSFLESKFEGQKPKYILVSWLLLLDLLIAALLSLAFARPVVKIPVFRGETIQRIILIDDSTSMLTLDGNPDRISVAKELAIRLIEETGPRDESIVITIGGTATLLGSTFHINKEELIRVVKELNVLGTGIDLRAGLALAEGDARTDLPTEVFVLTDAAFDAVTLVDFPIDIEWVFIGFEENNQAIIDPILEKKSSKFELFFKLVNYGSSEIDRELEIRVNGEVVSQQTIHLMPFSILPKVISLSGEIQWVEVLFNEQDALPIDDVAVVSLVPPPVVSVALVTNLPDPIDRAINAIPNTDLTIINPLDYSANAKFDLTIFREALPANWPSGKLIVFDPPMGDPRIELSRLERIISPLEMKSHKIIDGVDFSGVRWDYAWTTREPLEGDRLVHSENLPLLIRQVVNDSEIFVFLPQLTSGNFVKHPIFPIFLSNLVTYSRSFVPEQQYLWGGRLFLGNLTESHEVSIQTPAFIDDIKLQQSYLPLDEVGLYTLEIRDPLGERRYSFGVNAGDNLESDIRPKEWRTEVSSTEQLDDPMPQTVEVKLSSWLLLFAVLILPLESWRAWR